MADQLALYNAVLTELGADIVSDPAEGGRNTNALTAQFARVRQVELRKHGWKCARARVQLAADAAAPAFGWSAAYTVPSDFLRVWMIGELPDVRIPFVLEGSKILTDEGGPLDLMYVRDLDDVAAWDAALFDAMVFRLAHATCFRITGKTDLRAELMNDYRKAITAARTVSAMEAYPDTLFASDFEDARL